MNISCHLSNLHDVIFSFPFSCFRVGSSVFSVLVLVLCVVRWLGLFFGEGKAYLLITCVDNFTDRN